MTFFSQRFACFLLFIVFMVCIPTSQPVYAQGDYLLSSLLKPRFILTNASRYINEEDGVIVRFGLGYTLMNLSARKRYGKFEFLPSNFGINFLLGLGNRRDKLDVNSRPVRFKDRKTGDVNTFEFSIFTQLFEYRDVVGLYVGLPILARSLIRNPETTHEIGFTEIGAEIGIYLRITDNVVGTISHKWGNYIERQPPVFRPEYQMIRLGICFEFPSARPPNQTIELNIKNPPGFRVKGDSEWVNNEFKKTIITNKQHSQYGVDFEPNPIFGSMYVDITEQAIDRESLRNIIQKKVDSISLSNDIRDCIIFVTNNHQSEFANLSKASRLAFLQNILTMEARDPILFFDHLKEFLDIVKNYVGEKGLVRARLNYELYLSATTYRWLYKDSEKFSTILFEHDVNPRDVILYVQANDGDERETVGGCQIVKLEGRSN